MSAEEPILIVDDETDTRQLLSLGLGAYGYDCAMAADAMEAMDHLAHREYALMLSDVSMPQLSGLELLKMAKAAYGDLAVIMVTGEDDRRTAVQAMRDGAYDYIVKPIDLEELDFGIKRALEKRRLALELRAYQEELESKVRVRTRELHEKNKELERMIVNVIQAISVTLEVRDEYTAHHSNRVAELAVKLAGEIGMDDAEQEQVRLAALLHDIGKIGIRESVLHKAGKLSETEWEHIKTHPLISVQILQPIRQFSEILPAIRHEHESWDGTGYPDGLMAYDIPLHARIISVADGYDALTSDRPYRGALSNEEALDIMKKGAGRIWDPAIVSLFETMIAAGKWTGFSI